MTKTVCVTSARVSAPCDGCGKRADPCHIFRVGDTADVTFYCGACCPDHGAPLLAAAQVAIEREEKG